MEARLAARAAEVPAPVQAPGPVPTPDPAALNPAVPPVSSVGNPDLAEAAAPVPPDGAEEPAAWPDESAESAFRAEARDRGEAVPVAPPPEVEDVDPKGLPPLDTLVRRIPGPVMEALDDLFRARFVRVQKVPRRALKSAG